MFKLNNSTCCARGNKHNSQENRYVKSSCPNIVLVGVYIGENMQSAEGNTKRKMENEGNLHHSIFRLYGSLGISMPIL